MELNREVYVMEANAVQEKVPRIANLQDLISGIIARNSSFREEPIVPWA